MKLNKYIFAFLHGIINGTIIIFFDFSFLEAFIATIIMILFWLFFPTNFNLKL